MKTTAAEYPASVRADAKLMPALVGTISALALVLLAMTFAIETPVTSRAC